MLEAFYPSCRSESIYKIPFASYYSKGIRGVIFDIDNTLVPHDFPADERIIGFFKELHSLGLKTCLLSNNKEPRVRSFAGKVESSYIYKAGKPGKKGYEKAMERMGTGREETIFVGDQLFTDVYGANRAGIFSILVNPINPKEEVQIVLKRYLERPVLYAYKRKCDKKK